MKFNAIIGLCFALTGCATTYKPPVGGEPVFPPTSLNATKAQIMQAAKAALISDGYQITYTDDDTGVISTALKNQRLRSSQANCGTTLGLDYLDDNRTSSKVGFGLLISDKKITLKLNIESEYKPGSVEQNINLTCQSTTVIEEAMSKKIISILQNKPQ